LKRIKLHTSIDILSRTGQNAEFTLKKQKNRREFAVSMYFPQADKKNIFHTCIVLPDLAEIGIN